jgi:uncharacterized membrane protein
MILTRTTFGGRIAVTGVALFVCAVYAAGYLSLHGDELWIFQRVMGFTVAGMLLVFAVGKNVSLRVYGVLKSFDAWILVRPARASIVLTVFIFGYFALWCAVSFLRHYYFHSSYDLGIMDQVVWNTAQGNLFGRSIEVANDLGDHVRVYLAALSVIYLVIPSPYVLLAFQSLVLALSAWPLYRLAQRKLDSPAVGLAAACCVLAYPPLGFINRYDFHVEVVSIPLLIAAFERIDMGDLKNASVLMVLTLLCKENLGLTVAALGLMTGLCYKHWRFGWTWALVGIAYSSVALLLVIPAFRGEPSDTLSRYYWLGDTPAKMLWAALSQPGFVLQRIFSIEHILTFLQLIAPFAFLPLLGLPALLPAAPTLIYNFLAEWPPQTAIYHHYMAPLIPFIPIAAVFGLRRLVTNSWAAGFQNVMSTGGPRMNQPVGLGVSLMLAASLTSWLYQNPVTGNASLSFGGSAQMIPMGKKTAVPLIWSNDRAIREGLKRVPRELALLTTAHYAPHLSHRRWIEMIPRSPVSTLGPEAEVIFLNLRDLRSWTCEDYFETLRAATLLNFGVIFYRDDVILVQKGKGDSLTLQHLLENWSGCQ